MKGVPATQAERPTAASPHATTLRLRAQALDVLRDVLGDDLSRPYALLDCPRHGNTGDHAIWLGTLAAIEALGAPPPAYTCDDKTYDARELARRVGEGAILLLGGGNFGDIHPKHQRLRESVAASFPRNRLVQLPQTIRFGDPAALERARRAFAGRPRLTVLARDARSLATARDDLGLDARLCPDLATCLGPLARTRAPEPRIVWLARLDQWRRHAPPRNAADLTVADWPSTGTAWPRRKVKALGALLRLGLPVRDALSRAYVPVARRRLEAAVDLLSAPSVLVVDRLHGHVLAMLTGVRHVLLDDRTGKVRGYHEAWTRGDPSVAWAESSEEALAKARAWLSDSAGDSPAGEPPA
jgi:exopolysaccharide biosynthesis predicted pyruvyltransferase EpsI